MQEHLIYEIEYDPTLNDHIDRFDRIYIPTDSEIRAAEEKRQKIRNWNKICAAFGGTYRDNYLI